MVLQLLASWGASVSQCTRLFSSTQGVNVIWILSWVFFAVMSLALAIGSYRETKSRKSLILVIIYANSLLLATLNLTIVAQRGTWERFDSIVLILIIATSVPTVILARWKLGDWWQGLSHPIIRGTLGMYSITWPQLYLVFTIWRDGNGGLPGLVIILGHLLVILRLWEIKLAISQEGSWNQKHIGILIAESGNWLSWLAVTAAWLKYG